MNTRLLACLEEAIDKVLNKNCEKGLWDGLIHSDLSHQMAKAAAFVFDAAMDSQEFAEKERGGYKDD